MYFTKWREHDCSGCCCLMPNCPCWDLVKRRHTVPHTIAFLVSELRKDTRASTLHHNFPPLSIIIENCTFFRMDILAVYKNSCACKMVHHWRDAMAKTFHYELFFIWLPNHFRSSSPKSCVKGKKRPKWSGQISDGQRHGQHICEQFGRYYACAENGFLLFPMALALGILHILLYNDVYLTL